MTPLRSTSRQLTGLLETLFVGAVVCLLAAACTGTDVSINTVGPDDGSSTSVDAASGALAPTTLPATTMPPPTLPPTTLPPTTLPPDPVQVLVGSMTLEEKVGQLLIPVMAGTSASAVSPEQAANNQRLGGFDTMGELVANYHLGGVIYLGPNIGDAQQVTTLSAELQQVGAESRLGLGLFISVDQEGGRVARLSDGITPVPPARSFTPDVDLVRSVSAQTGLEVAAQGVNVVYAPVADLVSPDSDQGVIGDRSFGGDPAVVGAMVVGAIEGLQSSGVAAVVKHWPGHGDTTVDSHESLPTLDVDRALWDQRERVPFAAAMAADVEMVMVGHLAMPAIDPSGVPSSLSPVLVQQLLRDELGYDGIVITDALDMGAVDGDQRAEIAVQVVEAGGDILLSMPDIAAAHGGLVEAVQSGRISEDRLDESVTRVLQLKAEMGLLGTSGALDTPNALDAPNALDE